MVQPESSAAGFTSPSTSLSLSFGLLDNSLISLRKLIHWISADQMISDTCLRFLSRQPRGVSLVTGVTQLSLLGTPSHFFTAYHGFTSWPSGISRSASSSSSASVPAFRAQLSRPSTCFSQQHERSGRHQTAAIWSPCYAIQWLQICLYTVTLSCSSTSSSHQKRSYSHSRHLN